MSNSRNDVLSHRKPQSEHVPFLDGIRGYASLWVILGHLCNFARLRVPVLSNPADAVDIFMIVSGFLMTQHYLAREQKEPWSAPGTWLRFYLRRFFRIAPLYYFVLIPALLLFAYFSSAEAALQGGSLVAATDPTPKTMSLGMVLLHVSFLFGLLPKYAASLSIPDWSIGLEMQFYAAFPFLMLLTRKLNPLRLALLLAPVWLIFAKLTGVYATNKPGPLGFFPQPSFLPLRLGLFLIGILLAWAWVEDRGTLAPRSTLYVVAALALCRPASPVVAIVTALMILLLFYKEDTFKLGLGTPVTTLRNLLGNRLAGFLAQMSYGVYLAHMLLLIPALSLLNTLPSFTRQAAPAQFLLLGAIVLPATYAVAWLLSVLVEERCIRLGKIAVNALGTQRTRNGITAIPIQT